MPRENALRHRHEFALLFDVTNGNPNGDPDNGDMPRMDPETGRGLVSDVCLKRKVRNYVEIAKADEPGFRIYVSQGAILNEKHREAYLAERPSDPEAKTAKKLTPASESEAVRLRAFMCDNFFDIRAFGAVLSTGINAGQVRGPVQFGFGQSVEPVLPLELSITRMAATNEAEKKPRVDGVDDMNAKRGDARTFGRKHIIPYGLYRAHGFISAPLASDHRKGTGFNEEDLELLFGSLEALFEHDRSAARGEMATRKLIVFRHDSALGAAPAHTLFARIQTHRAHNGSVRPIGSAVAEDWPPARRFEDYEVAIDRADLPRGIELIERV